MLQLSTLTGQQQQIANQLQGNIKKAGTPVALDPNATADYINKSVAVPLLQQYDQTIMPRLKDSFAAVGALMSSRRGFAQQQSLQNLQNTVAGELGKAQLQNQQLSAQQALQYNQLGAEVTGQSHMALQPYIDYNSIMDQYLKGNAGGGQNPGFGGSTGTPNSNPQPLWQPPSGGQAQYNNQGNPGSVTDYLGAYLNGYNTYSGALTGTPDEVGLDYNQYA